MFADFAAYGTDAGADHARGPQQQQQQQQRGHKRRRSSRSRSRSRSPKRPKRHLDDGGGKKNRRKRSGKSSKSSKSGKSGARRDEDGDHDMGFGHHAAASAEYEPDWEDSQDEDEDAKQRREKYYDKRKRDNAEASRRSAETLHAAMASGEDVVVGADGELHKRTEDGDDRGGSGIGSGGRRKLTEAQKWDMIRKAADTAAHRSANPDFKLNAAIPEEMAKHPERFAAGVVSAMQDQNLNDDYVRARMDRIERDEIEMQRRQGIGMFAPIVVADDDQMAGGASATTTTDVATVSGSGGMGHIYQAASAAAAPAGGATSKPAGLLGSGWEYRLDVADELDDLKAYAADMYADELADRELEDAYKVWTTDWRESESCPGDEYFALAYKLIEKLSQRPSLQQWQFLHAMFQTCVPHIYAQDFRGKRVELLERFERSTFYMAALIMTPRRFGKTTVTGMGTSIIIYVGRGLRVVVFATSQEMSTNLMEKIKNFFIELPGAKKRIVKDNTRKFWVTCIDQAAGTSKSVLKSTFRLNRVAARAANVQGASAFGSPLVPPPPSTPPATSPSLRLPAHTRRDSR